MMTGVLKRTEKTDVRTIAKKNTSGYKCFGNARI